MNKKKKIHPILKILFGFFVVFISLYIASMSGYYESKIKDKVTLTNDSIKEFEDKINNGEVIDLNSYLQNDLEDYSNPISKLGDNITVEIENFVSKSSKIVTNILKSLF